MEKKYKVARRVQDFIYKSVAHKFLAYINSLNFDEKNELNNDLRINGPGILRIEEHDSAWSLLNWFDFFNT